MKKLLVVASVASLASLASFAFCTTATATPFSPSTLLDFSLSASSITEQCQEAKIKAEAALEAVANLPDSARTFNNTPQAIEEALEELNDRTAAVAFLRDVALSLSVRQAASDCHSLMDEFGTYTGQWHGGAVFAREDLFRAVRAYAAKNQGLNSVQQKLLNRELADFRRSGMSLPEHKRKLLAALRNRIIYLQSIFNRNFEDFKSSLLVSKEDLQGLSPDYIQALPQEGNKYRLNLGMHEYGTFMANAKNPQARRKMEFLFHNRAADKNIPILKEILDDRYAAAQLLGYPDHASYILEQRMAKTPAQVNRFLAHLEEPLTKLAQQELSELILLKGIEEGKKSDGIIHAWDLAYYENLLNKSRYQIDEEKIQEYFPLETVWQGVFAIYGKLFGVKFKEISNAAVWAPGVKLYQVSDNASGALVGYFYMDLFPRDGKYKSAESNDILDGHELPDGSHQKPVSALLANFPAPSAQKPSLLTHEEVEMICFHEFGHIMHQLLTRASYSRFSGTNVSYDFVEAPSQMLENWAWDPDILSRISGYYKDPTQKLPPALIDKMLAGRYVSVGLDNLNLAFKAAVDMRYHTEPPITDPTRVYERLQKMSLIPMTPGTHPEAGFEHITDGYDAGYYGYLWSQVYAQDMFARFESEGLTNSAIGWLYRKNILEPGSSRDELESVKAFLGREPNENAFLKSLGLGKS